MAFDRNCPLGDGCVGVEGFSICDCGFSGGCGSSCNWSFVTTRDISVLILVINYGCGAAS